MPVHKSAEKSARQNNRARIRNRMWKSRIKTARKKIEAALLNNQRNGLDKLFREYVSIVDRAVSRGVIHRNNAARKKMRMAHKLNSLQVAK